MNKHMTLKEILEQELNREWTEEEKQKAKELIDNYEYGHCEMLDGFHLILPKEDDDMSKKELTHTKNCKDCFYSVRNLCYIDGHNINYDVYRAYSCKYYKYYENNKQQK